MKIFAWMILLKVYNAKISKTESMYIPSLSLSALCVHVIHGNVTYLNSSGMYEKYERHIAG